MKVALPFAFSDLGRSPEPRCAILNALLFVPRPMLNYDHSVTVVGSLENDRRFFVWYPLITSLSSTNIRLLHNLVNRLGGAVGGSSRRSGGGGTVRRRRGLVAEVVHHLGVELVGGLLLRPAGATSLLALAVLRRGSAVRGRSSGLRLRGSLRLLRGVLRLPEKMSAF